MVETTKKTLQDKSQNTHECFEDVMNTCMETIDIAEQCYLNHIESGHTHEEANQLCVDKTNKIRTCISVTLCKDVIIENEDNPDIKHLWINCGEERWTKCLKDYSEIPIN